MIRMPDRLIALLMNEMADELIADAQEAMDRQRMVECAVAIMLSHRPHQRILLDEQMLNEALSGGEYKLHGYRVEGDKFEVHLDIDDECPKRAATPLDRDPRAQRAHTH